MKKLILLTILISCVSSVRSQGNVTLTSGIGFPEMINIGARYQMKNVQLGSSIGYFNSGAESISFCGDLFIHLGDKKELTDLPPWFMRIGLNYTRRESDTKINKYTYLNWRAGRDIYFTRNWGISVDLLVAFRISNKETLKTNEQCTSFCNFEIFSFKGNSYPGAGVSLFYKI